MTALSKVDFKLNVNDTLSIAHGRRYVGSLMVTNNLHVTVIEVREKAIRVQSENGKHSIWLPLAALWYTNDYNDNPMQLGNRNSYQLTACKWFTDKLDGFAQWFFNAYTVEYVVK